MNASRGQAVRVASCGLFLASIFYGYVWVGVTLPLSMLVLPLVFVAHFDTKGLGRIPPGAVLLAAMALPVAVQALSGRPPVGKPDAVVFLSVVYALATMVALRRAALSDRQLLSSLVIGGLITTVVMLVTMATLPPGRFLIPGQDFFRTQRKYAEASKERSAEKLQDDESDASADDGVVEDLGKFDRRATESEVELYEQKAVVRSALGRSNTIAWYMVFLFSVCLFAGSWWLAALFGIVAVATLTRFAVLFMAMIVAMRMAWRHGIGLGTLAVACLALGVAGMAGLAALKHADVVLPISLEARVWAWTTGFVVIALHPFFGSPRSEMLRQFNLGIIWTPNNGVLWAVALTGLVGAACYFGFVWVALREMRRMASASRLWAGLFVGFVILLTWNLFEPITLTPTLDVLLAAHYALAWHHGRAGDNRRVSDATV
jgi:hypothetical protein